MKKLFTFYLLLAFGFTFAQQFVYVDFGSPALQTTDPAWNNLTVPNTPRYQSGATATLKNSEGNDIGAAITVSDSFDTYNDAGATAPGASLGFPSSATRDSFFGAGGPTPFNGQMKTSGALTLTGLDPAKYYSFSIFASRNGVTDNREAKYDLSGATDVALYLNASSNIDKTANYNNLKPKADGSIVITVSKGPNNNNGNGFYYIGAMRMVVSDTPWSESGDPELALVYPYGGHKWEVGKPVSIKWTSKFIENVNLEISTNSGTSWTSVGTVPAAPQSYTLNVPNTISDNCLFRISAGTLSAQTPNPFSIIANEGKSWRIVVLGSSTAEGVGPANPNNAWVAKYKKYLEEMDTRYEVVNLARGGYTTYHILPTGTSNPGGTPPVDTERNITKALSLNPSAIIVNMPSNDAASGFSVQTQLANYNIVSSAAASANVNMWVTTPQPRNFGNNTNLLQIQLDMVEATHATFGERAIDFWTGFAVEGGNGILPIYNVDGIHMNDAAHAILFDRVIQKGIHTFITTLKVDDVKTTYSGIQVAPNPIKDSYRVTLANKAAKNITVKIIDMAGKVVQNYTNIPVINNSVLLQKDNLKNGVYILLVETNGARHSQKIIVE